jgi:hypothetical protein
VRQPRPPRRPSYVLVSRAAPENLRPQRCEDAGLACLAHTSAGAWVPFIDRIRLQNESPTAPLARVLAHRYPWHARSGQQADLQSSRNVNSTPGQPDLSPSSMAPAPDSTHVKPNEFTCIKRQRQHQQTHRYQRALPRALVGCPSGLVAVLSRVHCASVCMAFGTAVLEAEHNDILRHVASSILYANTPRSWCLSAGPIVISAWRLLSYRE